MIPQPSLVASVAGMLGVEFQTLIQGEGPDELFVSTGDGALTGAHLAGLEESDGRDQLAALGEQLADVGYIALKVGELVEAGVGDLPVDPQRSLDEFIARLSAQQHDNFKVEIYISKTAVLEGMAPGDDAICRRLYLFGETLCRLLDSGLQAAEVLWRDADRPAIVLVGDLNIDASGPLLRIAGGRHITREALTYTFEAPNTERMRHRRDDWIAWDKPWTDFLTPLHFDLRFAEGIESEVGVRLTTQLTKCGVLFTCDRARRARGDSNLLRADYRGATHAATVAIHDNAPLRALLQEQVDGLSGLVEWVYRAPAEPRGRDWFQDRLQFAQILVARNLELFQTDEERLDAFVRNASGLAPGLEQQWITFVEGKINEYVATVGALEHEVGSVLHEYVERTGALVKSLSDTMLAAVAVLVGSFIGAAFGDPFNAALFRIAVGVYAGYMALIPAAFGLTIDWMRFDTVRTHFHDRLAAFRQLLGETTVHEAVGNRPSQAEKSFKVTFALVISAYVLALALAVVAIVMVPGLVAPQ